MSAPESWHRAQNVLCVRLDALGDVLMTTPALRAVKRSCPARRITLLTSPAGAEAASLVPEIDEVLVYEAPWMKATPPRSRSTADYEMAERLRVGRFDAAVIFAVYSQNPLPAAFLCYLADIPLRLAHCHENPYQLLTHWVEDPEPVSMVRHEVQRQLDLVATVDCRTDDPRLSLRVPKAAHLQAQRLLGELGVDRRQSWIVVHPGASAPSRRYPAEGFAEVVERLAREDGCQIIFTGGEPEHALIEHIRGLVRIRSHSLAGRLALVDLAALVALAPILIANNTGPVHVAAAVGTPVVDLYALTNPQHTPWSVPSRVLFHDVPCKYCYKSVCPEGHHECLRRISPDEVVAATRELLREAAQQLRKPDRCESNCRALA
jgi:lipopolysaccharide heptosyltransferase II